MSERETFYTVDRMEGEIAVLVANGEPEWSSATIDDTERGRRVRQARERFERLRRTDPGGDVVL
jgi:hypothetical protein